MAMIGTSTTALKHQLELEPSETKHRIGIFGGTFNPPHVGQLVLAECVGKQLGLEKVYWMPNAQPVDATHASAIEPSYRMQLVHMAILDNPFFELELLEIRNGGESHTYQSMKELVDTHPENEYYFIMGANTVRKLPTWDHIDELSQIVMFAAGVHSGQETTSDYPVLWFDVPNISVSASEVRTRIRMNQSINYLVPEREALFIREYDLYRGLYD